MLFAGLALQVLIISVVPGGSPTLHAAAHLASYALVAWFVILNRSIPYLWLIGPVSNVFSIGDLLIVVGAFLALHTITASRPAFRRLAVIGHG